MASSVDNYFANYVARNLCQPLLTRFDTTLPVEIWNLLRSGLNPKTNAVGSLVFAVSVVLAIILELILLRRRPA